MRLLLVDDFLPMLETVQEYLAGAGYEVLAASSGEQAFHIATEQANIDVLITDIELPGMDGIELWNRVRAVIPSARAIFVSAHSQELISQSGAIPGLILTKPLNLPELDATLKRIRSSD